MSNQSLRQASIRAVTGTAGTYEKFLSKISPEPNSGCWLWTASTLASGYGQFYSGRPRLAHRYSYEVHKGEVPPGVCVLHKCDVPECVNPDHLFLGTHKDNAWDKVHKGRARGNAGTGNHLAKLDETKAAWARQSIYYGMTIQQVADVLNVHAATVRKIANGITWRDS